MRLVTWRRFVSLSFSSSVFVTCVLSSSSFGLQFVGDDSAPLQQLNLSLRRWCRHLLGWSSASPVAAVTGSLALAVHSALPSDVHSLCLVACVPWTTLPLALQTLPVSSGSVRPCKAHGRIGDPFQSHILATLAFPLGSLDRDRRLRHAAMASDLHGVRVVVF